MVTNLPKDGHPPSKIDQKEMYYRLGIWHIDLITKLRPGDNCHGWLASIHKMVTHHTKDKDGYPVSPG